MNQNIFDSPYYTKIRGMNQWGVEMDCSHFQPRWFETKEEAKEEARETTHYDRANKLIFYHPDLGYSFIPANSSNEQAINRLLRAFHPDAGVIDEVVCL